MVNLRFKRLVTRSFSTSELSRNQQNQQQNLQQLKTSTLELTEQEKKAVSERFTGCDRLPDNIGYIDDELSPVEESPSLATVGKMVATNGNSNEASEAKGIVSGSKKTTSFAKADHCHIDYFEESHIELDDLLHKSKNGSVLVYSCHSKKPRGSPRTALKVTFYGDVKYDSL